MRRTAILALMTLVLGGCTSGDGTRDETGASRSLGGDVAHLVDAIERIHPDPWRDIAEPDFRAAAKRLESRFPTLSRDVQLVELMRLTALLGERDGHSGIFPLDDHSRSLHFLPVRLYEFTDGFFVVDAIGHAELVGARLTSIGGRPVEEVVEAVEPLVPADNGWSRRARVAQYLVVLEILGGLGIAPELRFDQPADLEAVTADEYAAAFEDLFHPMVPQGLPHRWQPSYLARRLEERWSMRMPGALYLAYNVTLGDPSDVAGAIRRTAGPVILDLRHNPGGDNGTYPPLLEALRGRSVVALISRTTFSAAANFIAELEQVADVVFVGEPSGGAPNLYGDPVPIELPSAGLTVQIASVYWEKSTPDDGRLAIEPDVPVQLSSEDFFAGRDPALAAARRRALR